MEGKMDSGSVRSLILSAPGARRSVLMSRIVGIRKVACSQ